MTKEKEKEKEKQPHDDGHPEREQAGAETLDSRADSTADGTTTFGIVHSASCAVAGPVNFSELPGLPRLRYRILEYKRKLFIVVFFLVLESSLLPVALYYGLVLDTTLRHGIVFAIITSFFGIVTGVEFALRCYKLVFQGDRFRPLGGTRWGFDFTHWTLSFGYTVMTAVLVGASIPTNPLVRPLAMPVGLFFVEVGALLVWTGWMNSTGRRAPFKISSVPKGGRVRPLVYTLVEDVVAVDGAGERVYRQALMDRYEASARFRKMIAQQNWFWAAGALVVGIATLVIVWTVPEVVAYGIGWGVPLVFVIIWTVISVYWVRQSLRREKELWREEHPEHLNKEPATQPRSEHSASQTPDTVP